MSNDQTTLLAGSNPAMRTISLSLQIPALARVKIRYPHFVMTKLIPALLMCLLLTSGCARHYVITLNSGRQITTATKPRLNGVLYTYKDLSGQAGHVSASQVSQIMPASMAGEKT